MSCLLPCLSGCDRTSTNVAVVGQEDTNRVDDVVAPTAEPAIHVHVGDDIQAALDQAAEDPTINKVVIHEGIHRPTEPRQALMWFNQRHDGLRVVAEGDVTLTSANPDVAKSGDQSFPAIANHVVYFGDGIGPTTTLEGFTITGANNFVTTKPPVIEPTELPELKRTGYFYFDGGGVKIYGRSYPMLERLEIVDNYSSPCGAGISIEHRGFTNNQVTIRNCVFRNNRVPLTGAALDLLGHDKGSAALVENCLFINNQANCSMDSRSLKLGTWMPNAGHGAITLFMHSKAVFRNCTITGNRNGIDDLSPTTTYENCIFWNNTQSGGWPTSKRYETALTGGAKLTNCFVGGGVHEQRAPIDPENNVLDAPNPEFNAEFVPGNPIYDGIGYRPATETEQTGGQAVGQTAGQTTGEAVGQTVGRDATTAANRIATQPAKRNKTKQVAVAPQDPMYVRARGSNFNWYFYYTGQDGIPNTNDDICTKRHLFLPAGRKVHIKLESDDFLYSLKLPAQGANEIAIPGKTYSCTVAESNCGSYPLKGDQFCGYTHPNLVGRVIVQPNHQFMKSILANQISLGP